MIAALPSPRARAERPCRCLRRSAEACSRSPADTCPDFILRLSYRLELPPARLAARTGLVPAGHSGARVPASLLTKIPAPARQAFAHMTRLTTDKVDQLGLDALHERYPLQAGPAKNAGTVRLLVSDRPAFAPETRFCPDCLTGDGSPIQEAFGGPWRKIWHLSRRLRLHHAPAAPRRAPP